MDLTKLTDEELQEKRKKTKSLQIIGATIIGALIGVAIYNTVKNGFNFFTLFPLIFAFILTKSNSDLKAIDNEIKARNL